MKDMHARHTDNFQPIVLIIIPSVWIHTSVFDCQPIYLHRDIRRLIVSACTGIGEGHAPKSSAVNHQADMLTGWLYSHVKKQDLFHMILDTST